MSLLERRKRKRSSSPSPEKPLETERAAKNSSVYSSMGSNGNVLLEQRRFWPLALAITLSIFALVFGVYALNVWRDRGDRNTGSAREEAGGIGLVTESHGGASASGPEKIGVVKLASCLTDGIDMMTPFDVENIIAIGYHESSNRQSQPLVPEGVCIKNDNAGRMGGVVGSETASVLSYFVMYSRYRSCSATTAVDVGAPDGTQILAPVSGTVTELRQYSLYGVTPDYHLEIHPDGADPRFRMVMIHIAEPTVAVGSRIEAGNTPIAILRHQESSMYQLNEYCPGDYPHVHMQLNDKSIPKY